MSSLYYYSVTELAFEIKYQFTFCKLVQVITQFPVQFGINLQD